MGRSTPLNADCVNVTVTSRICGDDGPIDGLVSGRAHACTFGLPCPVSGTRCERQPGGARPSSRRFSAIRTKDRSHPTYRIWSVHGDVAAKSGTTRVGTQRQRRDGFGRGGGTTARSQPRHRSSTRRISVTQTQKQSSPRRLERAHPLFLAGRHRRRSARPSERMGSVQG